MLSVYKDTFDGILDGWCQRRAKASRTAEVWLAHQRLLKAENDSKACWPMAPPGLGLNCRQRLG